MCPLDYPYLFRRQSGCQNICESRQISIIRNKMTFAGLYSIYLLTGPFKPSITRELNWLVAAGIAMLVLLSSIYMNIASSNMDTQITALENQLVQGYSRLFDGRRRQAQDVVRAEQRIDQLFAQRQSHKCSRWLLITPQIP